MVISNQNNVTIQRSSHNPLLTPGDVVPSNPRFVVEGVFNCGAVKFGAEYILLCRVAESVKNDQQDVVSFPVVRQQQGVDCFSVVEISKADHPELDFSDARVITPPDSKAVIHLTSLSHLRIARSTDGVKFQLDTKPTIMPNSVEESWGMEDPRITHIGDTFYINYTAVSPNGAATSLISTKDFQNFTRHGIIFLPENKDVTIFPQQIGGKYYAFNRPVPNAIGTPDIWLSSSPDLLHWGEHKHFMGVCAGEDQWDNGRLGGGAPPVLIDEGWLFVYHGADRNNRYCMGVLLLDKDNPEVVLAKGTMPILEPETEYENNGFFAGVVFSCGCILEGNTLILYYGSADDKVCRADIGLDQIRKILAI